uniref:Secreted protein n=1 Tax=Parascaris univalens TaxID=6257 RepID=A0A914ZGJ7_PARUN
MVNLVHLENMRRELSFYPFFLIMCAVKVFLAEQSSLISAVSTNAYCCVSQCAKAESVFVVLGIFCSLCCYHIQQAVAVHSMLFLRLLLLQNALLKSQAMRFQFPFCKRLVNTAHFRNSSWTNSFFNVSSTIFGHSITL